MRTNPRWLPGYRHHGFTAWRSLRALEAVFASAWPLMAGVRVVGEATLVLPALFTCCGMGGVDLPSAVLTEDSMVGPASSR